MNNGDEETSKKSKLPYLPDDIILGILVRSVPLRSVGRFRCLSKLFCSLLSDPNFARNQLELTLLSNAVCSENRKLILSSQNLFLVDFDSIDVVREYKFKEDLILSSELPHKRKRRCIDTIGSSNGLVCVMCMWIFSNKHEEFLLYNPTTRESKSIPDLPRSLRCTSYHKMSYSHGFGFDALNIDYKVIKLVYCKDDEHKVTVCYVYSLTTDSWKRMTNLLPYHKDVVVSKENLKGAIHWVARIEGGESQRVLMAFDLEKEEFREMPLPDWVDEFDFERPFTMDTFNGCLCLVHYCFKMHNVIWVMNEYGLESSWSKIRISVSEYSSIIKPLCLTKNDEELLIALDGHFVYRKLKLCGEEAYMKIMAHTFVESLISPKSYGEHR